MANTAGYEEIQHTADWALRVWAPSLEALFVQSALGMNALAGMQLADGPRLAKHFSCAGMDTESLLVALLSELVYYAEQERLGFDNLEIRIEGDRLEAKIEGSPVAAASKTIKAVTYHDMKIRETECGYEVTIVFDV